MTPPRTAKSVAHPSPQAPHPPGEPPEDDPRWAAVVARDAAADGRFVYAVVTTGIYCRPSCPARRADRRNVRFHAAPGDAEHAGYRPCKRCRPDTVHAPLTAMITEACRTIETAETEPSLAHLARAANLSPFHFQRLFKAATGLTPKAYAVAHRNGRLRDRLPASHTVTQAIHDAGFNSSGRLYARSNETLGMTPAQARTGAKGETIRFSTGMCSLGSVLAAASDQGICAVLIGDDATALAEDLRRRFCHATLTAADATFTDTLQQVIGLIDQPSRGLDLPLDIRGTAFQHRVWQALRQIPPGETRTYSEIATAIGQPGAIRAVAGACAANAIAVAVPCHRVVRADGTLSGYRWGATRKKALLDREKKSRS